MTGKSENGLWWQVSVPTSYYYECFAWVSVDWVYTANTENVPVVAAPLPPTEELPATPPPANIYLLVGQGPVDYTVFAHSYGFGMTWTLKKTGTGMWDQAKTDLVYLGTIDAQRLQQNGDFYDITASVNPGETYTVQGSLITPATPGEYGEAWSVDGQWITFSSNRDSNYEVYILRVNGPEVINLTHNPGNDTQPNWVRSTTFDPTGECIVFTSDRDGNQEIYTMRIDRASPANQTNNPSNDSGPSGHPIRPGLLSPPTAMATGRFTSPNPAILSYITSPKLPIRTR